MADKGAKRRSWCRRWCAALLLITGGCIYDSSDRCDDNQRYDEERKICVCESNAISLPFGCQTCPAGTVVVNNACVAPP